MIETNKYSGITYVTTGNVKQSNDGAEFIKCGNMWIDDHGHMVEESQEEFRSLTTGISSNFGDPFVEEK
jgi:hypothetical protein